MNRRPRVHPDDPHSCRVSRPHSVGGTGVQGAAKGRWAQAGHLHPEGAQARGPGPEARRRWGARALGLCRAEGWMARPWPGTQREAWSWPPGTLPLRQRSSSAPPSLCLDSPLSWPSGHFPRTLVPPAACRAPRTGQPLPQSLQAEGRWGRVNTLCYLSF